MSKITDRHFNYSYSNSPESRKFVHQFGHLPTEHVKSTSKIKNDKGDIEAYLKQIEDGLNFGPDKKGYPLTSPSASSASGQSSSVNDHDGEKIPEASLVSRNLGFERFGDLPVASKILELLEMAICTLIFLPRLLFLVFFLTNMWVTINLATFNLPSLDSDRFRSETKFTAYIGNSRIRTMFTIIAAINFRLAGIFSFGICRIKVAGQRASFEQAPIVLFFPHSTMVDSISFFNFNFDFENSKSWVPISYQNSFVLKADIMKILDLRALMSIPIDRRDKNARQSVLEEIKFRAGDSQKPNNFYQILIAPEGTGSNGTGLLPFKIGAFEPGVAVQPAHLEICNPLKGRRRQITLASYYSRIEKIKMGNSSIVKYEGKGRRYVFLLRYFTEKISLLRVWMSLFFNLTLSIKITYHQPVAPSEEEKADPVLFARNVRKKCSDLGKIPEIDYCWEDDLFSEKFMTDYNGDPNFGQVKFFKLKTLYKLKFEEIERYFKIYLQGDSSSGLSFSDLFLVEDEEHFSQRHYKIDRQVFLARLLTYCQNDEINFERWQFESFLGERFGLKMNSFGEILDFEEILPETLLVSDAVEVLALLDEFFRKTRGKGKFVA